MAQPSLRILRLPWRGKTAECRSSTRATSKAPQSERIVGKRLRPQSSEPTHPIGTFRGDQHATEITPDKAAATKERLAWCRHHFGSDRRVDFRVGWGHFTVGSAGSRDRGCIY